jgi:hypothetical protein
LTSKLKSPVRAEKLRGASPAVQTVVEHAVTVRIEPGGYIDRLAGVCLKCDSEAEE